MTYDVVVIGSGPGGYVCAIKAAQLGLKVAVVEKRETFGGTCLNIGCIPSKALLHASELFAEAGHSFDTLGVEVAPKLNLAKMMAHKDATVSANVSGVAFLFKKNKIDTFRGTGRIVAAGKVSVTGDDGKAQEVEGRNIVIATGSEVAGIPGVAVDIDEKVIVSSTGALTLAKVPERLIVVGGGVIGLELGSVWARLGAKVTVVEFLDTILGGMDGEVSKQFQRMLAKQGFEFKLGFKVTAVAKGNKGASVTFEPVKGGDPETIDADVVLVATGRRPNTRGLGLEKAGVRLGALGEIAVDAASASSVASIHAVGDVTNRVNLTPVAIREGHAFADSVFGGKTWTVDHGTIASAVFTTPEVGTVGLTEAQAVAAGHELRVFESGFRPMKATISGRHERIYMKLVIDAKTDKVLGLHILGHDAGEIVQAAAIAVTMGATKADFDRTVALHPSAAEELVTMRTPRAS